MLSLTRRHPHAVHAQPPPTQVAKFLTSYAAAHDGYRSPSLLRLPGTSFVIDSVRPSELGTGRGSGAVCSLCAVEQGSRYTNVKDVNATQPFLCRWVGETLFQAHERRRMIRPDGGADGLARIA